MIKTYSYAKDGATKLTPHFRVREFRDKSGGDSFPLDDYLPALLERLYTRLVPGRPQGQGHQYRQQLPHPGQRQRGRPATVVGRTQRARRQISTCSWRAKFPVH